MPFGEYVPLSHLFGAFFQFLHIPMSNFSAGPEKQSLLVMNGLKVALYICYEIAFPVEVRNNLQQADFIA